MTFLLDPHRTWERGWEQNNPEPYPEPILMTKNGFPTWQTHEILERIDWHKRRWKAFKKEFPEWAVPSYGLL